MFYILLPTPDLRDRLMAHLKSAGILSVFHYVPLHNSPLGEKLGCARRELSVTVDVSPRLLRLPFYFGLSADEQGDVIEGVTRFLRERA